MTDELPEMRASDAERERVAEVLRDALAEGRLGMDEFQERLDSTYQARTRGELVPIVRDLPQSGADSVPAGTGLERPGSSAAAPRKQRWAERIGGTGTSRWGVALMSAFVRKGQWTVPRAFTGIAVMGGGELDLRDARFEDREVVIRCFTLMGGVSIVVPPGVEVDERGIGIMGGFDSSAVGLGEPGAPRVVITGLCVMGGVEVKRKLPREEKQLLREERRERRELERRERTEDHDHRHGGHGHGGHGPGERKSL
ncbi:MAG: DUF1707 SHOCT-like domain-containing protein [Streptomyces sp.]|uniref:DUF1707 SHOCT-like domain-containing protein n=1 Tax=Streptomyces sp. TaxID=1931 RepID=UPI003D6C1455